MRRGAGGRERSGGMKRAGRWLFNFAAAVSVVLWLAVLTLWIASYWRAGVMVLEAPDKERIGAEYRRQYLLVVSGGGVGLRFSRIDRTWRTSWYIDECRLVDPE